MPELKLGPTTEGRKPMNNGGAEAPPYIGPASLGKLSKLQMREIVAGGIRDARPSGAL